MSSDPPTSRRRRTREAIAFLVRSARRPLERFLAVEAASGIVLLAATAVALIWAGSPLGETYEHLWEAPLTISLAGLSISRTPEWLVNDGLMTIFFFVVGMEIRRELAVGALRDRRRAALPALGALGGMVAPALVFLVFGAGEATRRGWGIPTATDIAFAVGILTLLGPRVPAALRVLLLALAVIDDLGAIVVIAVFYTGGIAPVGILVASIALAVIVGMQRVGVRAPMAYVPPAVLAWVGVSMAGVHGAIAGVIVGAMTPVHPFPGETVSVSERLTARLHPWVAYGIMPLFALANAGVRLGALSLDDDAERAALGIALGLVVGKPLGITLASALALRIRVAALPEGLTGRHLIVLGLVGGVGFTMALFIAQLAYGAPALLDAARIGVLVGSGLAAVLGLAVGRAWLPLAAPEAATDTADEAELDG